MPNLVLKKLAKDANVSLLDVEKYWDEAKFSASKKFDKKDFHYWSYVMAIVKKRIGLTESLNFKHFLIENSNLSNKAIETIKSKCSNFISESRGKPLFMGHTSKLDFLNSTKPKSNPRDSSFILTNCLNFYFEEKFGYKNMRSVHRFYGTGNKFLASTFGKLHYIFPVNGYKFVWSPNVEDVTENISINDLQKIRTFLLEIVNKKYGIKFSEIDVFYQLMNYELLIDNKINNTKIYNELKNLLSKELVTMFDMFNYTNKNLEEAIFSENEINFQVKKYYAIFCGEKNQDLENYYYENIYNKLEK